MHAFDPEIRRHEVNLTRLRADLVKAQHEVAKLNKEERDEISKIQQATAHKVEGVLRRQTSIEHNILRLENDINRRTRELEEQDRNNLKH